MGSSKRRLAKLFSIPVMAIAGFLVAASIAGVGGATGTTVVGGEGCTPGYWKNHTSAWTTYAPGQKFDSVFDDAFGEQTLLQVLNNGSGDLNALGRHTVAALLNAASPSVDYAFTTAQVIAMFNAVYPGGDYEGLKDTFEAENELGAPGFCD